MQQENAMQPNDAGPILAEEEMLHDGEPVFGWAWSTPGGGSETSKPAPQRPAWSRKDDANPVFSRTRTREAGQ